MDSRTTKEAEQSQAKKTINEALSKLKTLREQLPQDSTEEKSEQKEIAAKIDGLTEFFGKVKEMVDAGALDKISKTKAIKTHLKDKSKCKTHESGTIYLLSLFTFAVKDNLSLDLAKALIKVLETLKANNKGFLIAIVKMASSTAQERIDGLLARLPKMEKAIATYESELKAKEAGANTAYSSSSSPLQNLNYRTEVGTVGQTSNTTPASTLDPSNNQLQM